MFNKFPYLLLGWEIVYLILIILLAAKIIWDTKNVSKTLAYLLLIIFLPVIGVIFYFSFGVNYRKNRFYRFKVERDKEVYDRIEKLVSSYHREVMMKISPETRNSQSTINFLFEVLHSPITNKNQVIVLKNGENKFPKLFEILKNAHHHIHLEYYIYKNDKIGQELAEILIEKAKEGVEVRFLYDDFGSRKLAVSWIKKLQDAGVQTAPVNKIRYKIFANRMNYRDHRKIVVVDGEHVFSGGINVADKYVNPNNKGYWRDTHLYIRGNAAYYFQYLFLTNWIFAIKQDIADIQVYFKDNPIVYDDKFVQVAASGPDTKPSIMLSTTSAIYEAQKRIYITTPYFIPVEPVLNALKSQALAGVDVRLLVPFEGDSKLVNAAAFSYYQELLDNKVRLFFYQNGFIHAKVMLVDDNFSSVGTANMDVRSQELNFEVNTHIYDQKINRQLTEDFEEDLRNSIEITQEDWQKRPKIKVFFEHFARLFSPLL